VAGMLTGDLTLDASLKQGWAAGRRACGAHPGGGRPRARDDGPDFLYMERAGHDRRSDRQWLDFQHDVTLRDIDIAVAENYVSVEHMKRYTTAGMAVDQGKTSNLNALLALAARTGRQPGEVGTVHINGELITRFPPIEFNPGDEIVLRLPGGVAHIAPDPAGVAFAVGAGDDRTPGSRFGEADEDLDGRGLARAVGPDEAEDMPAVQLDVERIERDELAVALGQVAGDHDGVGIGGMVFGHACLFTARGRGR